MPPQALQHCAADEHPARSNDRLLSKPRPSTMEVLMTSGGAHIEVARVSLRDRGSEINAAAVLHVRGARPPAFEVLLRCERTNALWRPYQPGRDGPFSLRNLPPEMAERFTSKYWLYTLILESGPSDLVVGDVLAPAELAD